MAHIPRHVVAPSIHLPHPAVAAGCLLPLPATKWLGGLRFSFLNHERCFSESIDWRSAAESRLWQYNLHYFDWLRQSDCDLATSRAHIVSWIAANPAFEGVGWEPYPTSLRLVNWIGRLFGVPAGAIDQEIIGSVALQTAWLASNIEYQLGANHLFVNLKALLFASAFLGGDYGRDLARRTAVRFERELAEQFLADGGHYERSPMYHAILTQDLLELTALVERNPTLLPGRTVQALQHTTERALGFAAALQPPDDGVFLFNDAAAGIAPTCGELLSFAEQVGKVKLPAGSDEFGLKAYPDTGYYVVRSGGDMVVFDCGEVGPGHQPGHAHCDTLSFELYLNGRRILTNAGNHDYIAGPVRSHARSTCAHNTVVVDDCEQSEIWSAFRVGRRAHPLYASLEPQTDGVLFRGAHDGYRCLPGRVTHGRSAFVGQDFVIELKDELSGGGYHRAVSWLHAAAGLDIRAVSGDFEIVDERGERVARLEPGAGSQAELIQTPRYPQFGVKATGMSLRLSAEGELPIRIVCRLVPIRTQ
jgi:uncharacterized heparinase superfamily protein